ncbi:MAG: hypothetical protein ACJ761_04090 [Chloroflexota bacterium]
MRVPSALAIALLAAACGATPATPPPTIAALPSVSAAAATGPIAFEAGFPSAGTYTTTAFQPPLTMTIDDRWQVLFQDDSDELGLEDDSGDGTEFLVGRVSQVVDPGSHEPVAAPDDLVAWIRAHPALTAGNAADTTVDGRAARTVDVTTKGGAEVEVFAFPTGNLPVPDGVRNRFTVVPLDGPDLVITTGGHTEGFDAAVARAAPILASLRIGHR